jgi:hypothetical protein
MGTACTMSTTQRVFVSCVLLGLCAPVWAQGLPSAIDDVRVPMATTATTDDATSLLINPAGLAHVNGLELNAGTFTRADRTGVSQSFDGIAAVGFGGIVVGGGAGLSSPLTSTALSSVGRVSGAMALSIDNTLALGVAVHQQTLLALTGGNNAPAQTSIDIGTQVRWSRALALGAAVQGIGGGNLHVPGVRVGVGFRPFAEVLTLGLEARAQPGTGVVGEGDFWTTATISPAATAVVQLGGWSVGAGVDVRGLGLSPSQPAVLNATMALGVDLDVVGARLIGGVTGIGDNVGGGGGARLRFSTEPRCPAPCARHPHRWRRHRAATTTRRHRAAHGR